MNEHDYETKTAGGDVSAAFDDFMRAFEAFKETNDERLGEIERRMSADVVTTDKLSRIDRAIDEQKRVIDELTHRATRPGLARNRVAIRGSASAQVGLPWLRPLRRDGDAA